MQFFVPSYCLQFWLDPAGTGGGHQGVHHQGGAADPA